VGVAEAVNSLGVVPLAVVPTTTAAAAIRGGEVSA
jgi:hypothetical protein